MFIWMISLHIPWEKGQTLETHSVFQPYCVYLYTVQNIDFLFFLTKSSSPCIHSGQLPFRSKSNHIMPVNLPQAFPDVLRDQDFHLILSSNEIKMGILLSLAFVPRILLSLHRASLSTILVKLMPRFSHATHMDVPALRVATLSHMLWNFEACDMWISPNRPTTDEDPGKTQVPSRSSLEKDERLLIGGWLNHLCVELPGYCVEYEQILYQMHVLRCGQNSTGCFFSNDDDNNNNNTTIK